MRPLLVGEQNPYGADPAFALYPLPEHASGGRLARILGLSRTQYLRAFDRVNLLTGTWSAPAARERAEELLREPGRTCYVLLGSRVNAAFGYRTFEPFRIIHRHAVDGKTREPKPLSVLALPHPSGRNRTWNEPGAKDRARKLVEDLLAW